MTIHDIEEAASRLIAAKLEAGEPVPLNWVVGELLAQQGASEEEVREAVEKAAQKYDPGADAADPTRKAEALLAHAEEIEAYVRRRREAQGEVSAPQNPA